MRVRKNKNTKADASPGSDAQLSAESNIGIIGTKSRFSAVRLRTVLLILAVIFAVVLIAWFTLGSRDETNNDDKELPTEATLLDSELQRVKAEEPAKSASTKERAAYYDKTFLIQYEKRDYRAATTTFKERIAISQDGIDYNLCYWAVLAYKNIGDRAGAIGALDVMQKAVPPDDQENGFFAQNVYDLIERTRKDLQ